MDSDHRGLIALLRRRTLPRPMNGRSHGIGGAAIAVHGAVIVSRGKVSSFSACCSTSALGYDNKP